MVTDQKMYKEVFLECLKSVPSGPTVTKYNDWDEVVRECRLSADSISSQWQQKEVNMR